VRSQKTDRENKSWWSSIFSKVDQALAPIGTTTLVPFSVSKLELALQSLHENQKQHLRPTTLQEGNLYSLTPNVLVSGIPYQQKPIELMMK
jgi:hypothetical protein